VVFLIRVILSPSSLSSDVERAEIFMTERAINLIHHSVPVFYSSSRSALEEDNIIIMAIYSSPIKTAKPNNSVSNIPCFEK
jgi:hypothetical protein